MGLRKRYVLINSDHRTGTSRSTTDFTVQLQTPIEKVVKTDLVDMNIQYRLSNIPASPDNRIGITTPTNMQSVLGYRWVQIPEQPFSPRELASYIIEAFGGNDGYVDMFYTSANRFEVHLWFPDPILADVSGTVWNTTSANYLFECPSATFRAILGLSTATTTGTYDANIGAFGGIRWVFPNAVNLSQLSPYLMIQSNELGSQITDAHGRGFWRMVVNDPDEDKLYFRAVRVDDYQEKPRTLQTVDIRLAFPDGTPVENRGGSVSLLVEVIVQE